MKWIERFFLFLAFMTAIIGFSQSWNLVVIFITVFVVMMLGKSPRFYYYYFCRDAEKIGQYLTRTKDEAYHAFFLALTKEEYETAHQCIHRFKRVNPILKKLSMAQVFFGQGKWSQVAQLIEEINQPKYTFLLEMYMAIAKDDVSTLEKLKTKKVPVWQQTIYQTELAFAADQLEEAKRLGDLAINQTKGLQHYSLVEARRLQEEKGNQGTYF